MNDKIMAWLFIFAMLAILVLVCLPLALIWSVNTLFGLSIQISLKTWAAALILSAPFAASYGSKK